MSILELAAFTSLIACAQGWSEQHLTFIPLLGGLFFFFKFNLSALDPNRREHGLEGV